MTSALSGAHAPRLTSVTGPAVTAGAAARGGAVVTTRPVHATPAVVRPSRAATEKFLSLMAILRHERASSGMSADDKVDVRTCPTMGAMSRLSTYALIAMNIGAGSRGLVPPLLRDQV